MITVSSWLIVQLKPDPNKPDLRWTARLQQTYRARIVLYAFNTQDHKYDKSTAKLRKSITGHANTLRNSTVWLIIMSQSWVLKNTAGPLHQPELVILSSIIQKIHFPLLIRQSVQRWWGFRRVQEGKTHFLYEFSALAPPVAAHTHFPALFVFPVTLSPERFFIDLPWHNVH